MNFKITLILFVFSVLNLNAQNTVTIQGNFSTTDPDPVFLNCNRSIRTIVVQVLDGSSNPVVGEVVTVSKNSGSGTLSGTLNRTTDSNGNATFNNLSISINNAITLRFDDTGTADDTTKSIQSIECDVNEVWTNFGGFWNSSSSSLNPTNPNNSHELLAFEFNGINYSTGVDDTKLTNNGVSFTALTMRSLPVASLPTTGSNSYFIGLGQLADGIDSGVNNGSTIPFEATLNGNEIAAFLTDGSQGLDLGTNVTNIPGTTTARFNLSSSGITTTNIGDGIPDILISQTAQPSNNIDELEFVDTNGATVGNVVSLNITTEPVVGNWIVDFYEFDSTQGQNNFINTPRPIHFFAVDLASFGITAANANDAVALLYRPNGNSDPSFLAFNEPSLGVATQLNVLAGQPTQQNCDGTIPSDIQVQLEDQNDNAVAQSGLNITATLESGPGALTGTTTRTTDGSGTATFNDLEFTVGGNHVIRFSFAGLDDALTSVIGDATGCSVIQWTGNINSDWSNTGNWSPAEVPDGNNDVIIPNGRPNYPVLDIDAGAGDLTMGNATSIELNGFLLALNGSLSGVSVGASLDASAAGSELYMSDSSAQNIPAGFVDPDVANFIVENAGGVTLNSTMNINEVLDVRQGTLTTGGHITMVCSFIPRQTAQIDAIDGSISGNITVEQCFPARRAFRLVSASTTTTNSIHDNWQEGANAYNDSSIPNNLGTHITGLNQVAGSGHSSTPGAGDQTNGLDWQPSGDPSMYSFNSSTQSWATITETENTSSPSTPNLNIGDAYRLMIRGARKDSGVLFDITDNTTTPTDTKLRSTGTVQNGSFSQSVSSTSQNWSLVGNPYHAMVNMKQLIDNSTNVDRFYTIWDPTLGGTPVDGQAGGRGAFVTYNVDEIDFTIGGGATGSSDINNFLQPYQAAFFRTSSNGTASVDFTENAINVDATQTNTFSTSGISPYPHIYTKLFAAADYGTGTPLAFNQIRFDAKSDNAFNQFDAQAFYNVDETLARLGNNQIWAIENRNIPVDGETLPLLTYQYRRSNYTFEFEVGQFDGIDVYLEDTYLDETHLLDDNQINTVNFTIDETIPESLVFNRFNILFQEDTFSVNDNKITNQIKVYPNPTQNVFNINFGILNLNQVQISITDLQGREVIRLNDADVANKEIQVDVAELSSGMYILNVESQRFHFTDKLVVE